MNEAIVEGAPVEVDETERAEGQAMADFQKEAAERAERMLEFQRRGRPQVIREQLSKQAEKELARILEPAAPALKARAEKVEERAKLQASLEALNSEIEAGKANISLADEAGIETLSRATVRASLYPAHFARLDAAIAEAERELARVVVADILPRADARNREAVARLKTLIERFATQYFYSDSWRFERDAVMRQCGARRDLEEYASKVRVIAGQIEQAQPGGIFPLWEAFCDAQRQVLLVEV